MRCKRTCSSPATSITTFLPIRRTSAIARPSSACNGGSNVLSALIPGAIADSISAPRTAAPRRRAVISTSGSSGIHEEVTNRVNTSGRVGQARPDPASNARKEGDMATVHTPPIDLYAESAEGFGEEQHDAHSANPPESRPVFNGDRDDRATEQSHAGLERVLGW